MSLVFIISTFCISFYIKIKKFLESFNGKKDIISIYSMKSFSGSNVIKVMRLENLRLISSSLCSCKNEIPL